MPFSCIDAARVAKALAAVALPARRAEVFLERLEVVTYRGDRGFHVRREEGLAVRLQTGERRYLASRDSLSAEALAGALRQVARVVPERPVDPGSLGTGDWEVIPSQQLRAFHEALLEQWHQNYPSQTVELQLESHRRWVRVVGSHLVAEQQEERFYSLEARMPWGARFGRLFKELDEVAATDTLEALGDRLASRDKVSPDSPTETVVLGPHATAVLLHEAVAHSLEADQLGLTGNPARALGARLGPTSLDVIDDPTSAPTGLRRIGDDEGLPTRRRWLLRRGVVEEPLADALWSWDSEALSPGAARCSSRHEAPDPRSSHLEVPAGQAPLKELLEASSLYLPEVTSGWLDPLRGLFTVCLPLAFRLSGADKDEVLGPCVIQGLVPELLSAIDGLGDERCQAGAGWCAKRRQRLPVWATVPAMRLVGVRIQPETLG